MIKACQTDKTTREYYYSSKAALTFRILITRVTYTVTWKNKNEGRAYMIPSNFIPVTWQVHNYLGNDNSSPLSLNFPILVHHHMHSVANFPETKRLIPKNIIIL